MSNEPILKIDNLTISRKLPGKQKGPDKNIRLLLSGISFTIGPGETFGLVGPSGVGKTSLALAVMGLLPDTMSVSGLLNGEEIKSVSAPGRAMVAAGMIFQDAGTSLNPAFTIGRQLMDAAAVKLKQAHHSNYRAKAKYVLDELLSQVGMDEPGAAKLYPFQLSSGMQQRVLIAIALAGQPRLLIADEPTSSLDLHLRGRILSLLKKYQGVSHCGILLISHDLLAIRGFADNVAVINDAGLMVESGPTADIFTKPKDDYTKRLLDSLLTVASASAIKAGLRNEPAPEEEDEVHA